MAALLPELSLATGMTILADSTIGKQIALVWVDDVEGPQLLDRLAAALDGKWQKDGTTWKLVQDTSLIQQEQTAAIEAKIADLKASFEPYFKATPPTFDAAAAKKLMFSLKALNDARKSDPRNLALANAINVAQSGSPLGRLLVRLLQGIPLSTLAREQHIGRMVFALKPTNRQYAFGKNAAGVIADFAKEQQIWIEALKGAGDAAPENSTVSDPLIQRDAPDLDPAALRLVVNNWQPGAFSCNLVLKTEAGQQILTQFSARSPGTQAAYDMAFNGDDSKAEPILISKESEMMLDAFGSRFSDKPSTKPLDPQAVERLLDPVKYEPLSWMATDGFLALARPTKSNLIAWIPDSVFLTTSIRQPKRMTPAGFRAVVSGVNNGVDIIEKDGWMTVRPKNPIDTREGLEDRVALGQVSKAIVAKKGLRLLDYAKYVANVTHDQYDGFGIGYIFLLDPAAGSVSDGSDWNLLRLYGSLSDQQRSQLRAGQTLPFSGLTPKQRDIVDVLTYGREINNAAYQQSNMYQSMHPSLEPTEYLPNGLPSEGFLSMQTDHKDLLFGYSKSTDGSFVLNRSITPETIAWFEYEKAHPSNNPIRGQAELVGYAFGDQNLNRIRLNYDSSAWNEYRMIENNPPTATPVPWQQLPEATRTAIQEGIKRREQDGKAGQTSPPPPQARR